MKLIKELGVQEYGHSGNRMKFSLYLCPECKQEIRIATSDFKRRNPKKCRPCNNKRRALTHGFSGEKLYGIWNQIKYRCNNINHKHYKDYGGRGITLCKEWYEYEVFRKWCLENGVAHGLSIDRINNDGNYEPSNCRFATSKEQANNKRTTKKEIKCG